MKYAKSLAYGGELIDALECEHADFKRLVPLCPNCSNPVHLRIGGDRLSAKGTTCKVGPHWAHFPGKSPEEVSECELRVNSYSRSEREQIQSIARGQRKKLIEQWFWQCFIKSEYIEKNYSGSVGWLAANNLCLHEEHDIALGWPLYESGWLRLRSDLLALDYGRFLSLCGKASPFPTVPLLDLSTAFLAIELLRTKEAAVLLAECFQFFYQIDFHNGREAFNDFPGDDLNANYEECACIQSVEKLVWSLISVPWGIELTRLGMSKAPEDTAKTYKPQEKKDYSKMSLDQLVRSAEEHAQNYHDGHLSILKFTTHWKAFWGTPDLDLGASRKPILGKQGFTSLREALVNLLAAEVASIRAEEDPDLVWSSKIPAWFAERMTNDYWKFGLLMISGQMIAIECIDRITEDSSGTLWLDCTLTIDGVETCSTNGVRMFYAPCPERKRASINASHVVAAFDLSDT